MGPRFDETQRGRKFYDADLPKLVKAISEIPALIKAIQENTAELKRRNDLKAAELYPNHTRGGNDEADKER